MRKITFVFVCLFILGAGLRAVGVWRPVDRPSWRECDIAGIARNYQREGMNLLSPRIDWRGDGPGFAEMEFPLYPWLIAAGYQIFGTHEVIGRLISYGFSLLALLFFFKLARYLLPEPGAVIASLFFALNPLVIEISNSLQPEGLMFLSIMLAVYAFIHWLDDERSWTYYGVALGATALAILAKASAAHIGLLLAALVLNKMGWRAFRDVRLWVFAVASLLPSVLWYTRAHRFWLVYGNSLGVSDETHFAGWDLFTNPTFIRGILRTEALYVWMFAGIMLVACALLLASRERAVKYGLWWFASTFIFYLVAARTTGDEWAYYYHVISVPPAALLIGAGVNAILRINVRRILLNRLMLASGAVAILIGLAGVANGLAHHTKWLLEISFMFGLTALVLAAIYGRKAPLVIEKVEKGAAASSGFDWLTLRTLAVYFVVVCLAATLLLEARLVSANIESRDDPALRICAQSFATALPEGELIVASGGPCKDESGFPVAYNASYMFYWTDRKGFNVCVEDQSIAKLENLAGRGARFFIAEKSALKLKQGFEAELLRTFPVMMECDEAYLFRLTRPAGLAPDDSQR